jgi:excinuclease UvrABC nuclease subunit
MAQITGVPNAQGVYLLTPAEGIPYLGWSGYLEKRLSRLLTRSNSIATPRNGWARVEYWLAASRLETSLLLYRLARESYPDTYRKRLKLRDPWFLSLLRGDGFARLAVRNRLSASQIAAYGPFANRETAERAQQGTLGLFQIRRCDERLEPSEDHPGCIYGEMNHCMRPCQLRASAEEYNAEVQRLSDFLKSNGKHMITVLLSARDRASEETDFEQAARLHKEIEKLKSVAGLRAELIAEVESLNGIAVTRATGESRIALWPMLSGYWQAPLVLDFSAEPGPARSLDQQLREQLTAHLSIVRGEGVRTEEISLLSRWYYSSWRDGEWFPFKTLAELNYRKLVREISVRIREHAAR